MVVLLMKETRENHKPAGFEFIAIVVIGVHRFIGKYCIILAVNTPENLLCFPTCAKFSQNGIHSLMNPVPTLTEEDGSHCTCGYKSNYHTITTTMVYLKSVVAMYSHNKTSYL
jgi:hypothetical protein